MPSSLRTTLIGALRRAAEPSRAPAMQAYMKSVLPFWGVPAPRLRILCREVFAEYPFTDADAWRTDVLALWRQAERREERYAAIALAKHRQARAFQTLETLPMYEELIVTGAWWDYVDDLAAYQLGLLLEKYPRELRRTLLSWSRSDDLWKRRSAILAQLKFREGTDLALLYACIEPALTSKEFFLRKAIGWSLRELGKHRPEEVRRYVQAHQAELSPLSRREAMKHLTP